MSDLEAVEPDFGAFALRTRSRARALSGGMWAPAREVGDLTEQIPWVRVRRNSHLALVALNCLCVVSAAAFCRGEEANEANPGRVRSDLQALWEFGSRSDPDIRDASGVSPALDVRVSDGSAVKRSSAGLQILRKTLMSSDGPAARLSRAVKESEAITIEAWIHPEDLDQAGPARIVTLSRNPGERNFTLGQDKARFEVRLRTTQTSANGIPALVSTPNAVAAELTHVAYTWSAGTGTARLYVNGRIDAEQALAGTVSNWDESYALSLGNELTGDRPWRGRYRLVAIYNRELSADEVARNHAAGVRPAVDYAALLPRAASRPVDFVKDVQPLFRKHCFECHALGNEQGGVNLGMRQRFFEGGDHGPVVLKGDSAESRLIHLVAGVEPDEVMPPDDTRLTGDDVAVLRAWVDQGAPWPDGADVLDPQGERAKAHWAFQPLKSVAAPAVTDASWPRSPIDGFILSRQEADGIRPAGPAAARQMIRRVTFDLIGLPPTPEEVRDFTAATERDPEAALAALVDRLLESPHYGERWGRHWLDVARYADSDGQESDRDRPTAYHYRDFVIRSFNEDRAFDEFVRWQLAGDEFEPENPEAVAATGFLAAGPFAALPDNLMEDERLRNRYNELDDIVSTIGTGMLGLTLGCCRCHDHKYDAVPSRDYYRIMAAFHGGQRDEVPLGSSSEKTLGYRDPGPDPKPAWLFHRGDYYDHGTPVRLGFVSILTRGKAPEDYRNEALERSPAKNSSNQRRALAAWMTDVEQGAGALVARVIVNRIWQHHFGQGLVRTAGDFGVRSEPPTHPELLEWLASDLVENGWKIKRVHRMILMSSVYRQASVARETPAADPDNRLLWKMPLGRLEAEVLRDSMLAVSGTLNAQAYGPAVKPPVAAEAVLARNLKDPYPADVEDGPATRRRSVYLFHKRVVPYPLLQAFDKPDAQQSCGRRDNTTVAPQALALLNDPFVRRRSLDFADRLLKDAGPEPEKWIDDAFRLALARTPAEEERSAAALFLRRQEEERQERAAQADPEEIRRLALADFCQAVFGLNEFLYVD